LKTCTNCSPLPLAIVTLQLAKILWTLICRHRRSPPHPPLLLNQERGFVMHTAPFGHGAVYDPDTLRTLGLVFDNAWASLAHNFDSGSSERARLRLASIILEFASAGDRDPLELKCRAIGAMHVGHAA
jgi:hypothetical protein